jgi:dimethylhistidine N-methyltransferase
MNFTSHTLDATALNAVDNGLSANPKTLPSWLFYDDQGNKFFQSIMHMPEYYLTRCEYAILDDYKEVLLNYFSYDQDEFQLIELGAGDGLKTEVLLEYFVSQAIHFNYIPVDVSPPILSHLTNRLRMRLPELDIHPQNKKYEEAISLLPDKIRKVILFLGANIGNYTIEEAAQFLKKLSSAMNKEDLLLIGFDLKKDPRIIQQAYDDAKGLTRAFNLNVLKRLNTELGADFRIDKFSHFPVYDPASGTAKSFLVSQGKQQVFIAALNKIFEFEKWETIHTEVSQKYDLCMIEDLSSKSGLRIAEVFYDSKKLFCDVLITK